MKSKLFFLILFSVPPVFFPCFGSINFDLLFSLVFFFPRDFDLDCSPLGLFVFGDLFSFFLEDCSVDPSTKKRGGCWAEVLGGFLCAKGRGVNRFGCFSEKLFSFSLGEEVEESGEEGCSK